MVLFQNIQIGQEVEILRSNGTINLGKVRFKGSINGRKGDWIGIEFASQIGNSDGMLNGRRYFIVRPGYGLFTTSEKIRFISINRSSFNNYKSLPVSKTDDDLLKNEISCRNVETEKKVIISKKILEESFSLDKSIKSSDTYSRYPLRHLIGKVEVEKKPKSKLTKTKSYQIPTQKNSYYLHHEDFITPSTIPDYFIPRYKLKTLTHENLSKVHTPKTHNHYKMRDFLHDNWWNDVSL